jgi:Ala-tRNA(Pro) deacylase
MTLSKLRKFLDLNHVKYLVISHSLAYTAQGVAALAHVSGKKLAKTVIVKIDGILAMAVIPASFHVDLERIRKVTGAQTIEVATEVESKTHSQTAKPGRCRPSDFSTICPFMRIKAWLKTKRSPSALGLIVNWFA